ncbi:hypothetical protein L596_001582 [Steinernema carpocapsae]|uniref:C2H2-type domain-containing protein n=1 Tax=Steinernema carpocapsae TaxID=34508 RepID=A0A4U8ULM4_STECR|nr:hypothetical protein L596_001582 [Steinernema carpocapsae]
MWPNFRATNGRDPTLFLIHCAECKDADPFRSIEALESHIWLYHIGAFSHVCDLCLYPAPSLQKLDHHFDQMHPGAPNILIKFRRSIKHETVIRQILEASVRSTVAGNEANAKCEVDAEFCKTKEQYAFLFKCEECKQTFPDLLSFEFHIWAAHVGDFQYYCGACRYPCLREAALLKHVAKAHDLKPHEIGFKRRLDLEDRFRTQLRELIEMDIIIRQAPELATVEPKPEIDTTRIARKKKNSDPSECLAYDIKTGGVVADARCPTKGVKRDFVGAKLVRVDNELVAMAQPQTKALPKPQPVDGFGPSMQPLPPLPRKPATTMVCPYCAKTLKYPSKIEAHLRTHTGERPYMCEICGVSFTQKTPLRMHLRRHLNQKPFVCKVDGCQEAFISGALLNAHRIRKHEVKPAVPKVKTEIELAEERLMLEFERDEHAEYRPLMSFF